jgi:phosphoribosylanthranilate isomerase
MIKVKICGITNLEDAVVCSKEGADALGFIFSKKSPRYLNEKEAQRIIANLDPFVTKVGVFVDEEKEKAYEIAKTLSLNAVQFHGRENPAYCAFFKPKFKVIKVFFPQDRPFEQKLSLYANKIDAVSFDVKYAEKLKGKNTLPRDVLKEASLLIKKGIKVIISGGLNLKNISQVIKFNPYAVDVAGGLEKMVGKKDLELVRLFIQKVKNIK